MHHHYQPDFGHPANQADERTSYDMPKMNPAERDAAILRQLYLEHQALLRSKQEAAERARKIKRELADLAERDAIALELELAKGARA